MLTDFDSNICPDFLPDYELMWCTYYEHMESEENGFCKKPQYYRCLADIHRQIPLSYSSINDFLTCHYLYYLKAIRGIQIKDHAKSSALKCGTLWDAVLQKHLGGIDRDTDKPYNIPAIIEKYEIDPMDVAKVRGLYRAFKVLEVQIDPGFELQAKVETKIDNVMVTGYYDRKYADSFVENKLSGRPDLYFDPYFIQSQVGTYFLGSPDLASCIMEVVRIPGLKQKKDNEESPEEYAERTYQNVITRPSYYFIGWNAKTRRYGKKFFRNEFDLKELEHRFKHVYREIYDARRYEGWYKNDRACNNVLPGIVCDMLPLCRYNNFNEDIYQIRERKVTF